MWTTARAMWAEPAVPSPSTGIRPRDWILAAVVLAAVVLEAFSRSDRNWQAAFMGVGLVLAVAVILRRTHYLVAVGLAFGVFLVVDVAAVVVGAKPVALYSGVVVLVLVYSLFRWGAGRDIVLGLGIVVLEFVVSTITDFSGPNDALGGAAVLLFAAALGAAIRYRAIVRDQLVEQVKRREREHLARELHDTVAHHVSAIATQAQASLVLASSSPGSGSIEALETIADEAVKALAEMRTMVAVLRDRAHQPPRAPSTQLADIERLAATGSDSPRVDVELSGDLTDLPSSVQAALYRVAQEAVTNAQRHARMATRIEVSVIGKVTEIQLTVSDDGTRTAAGNSPGYGLVGMAERVSLIGGELQTGPGPDRGWLVRAVLPRPRRET